MRAAPTSDGRRVSVRPEDLERTAHWLRGRAEEGRRIVHELSASETSPPPALDPMLWQRPGIDLELNRARGTLERVSAKLEATADDLEEAARGYRRVELLVHTSLQVLLSTGIMGASVIVPGGVLPAAALVSPWALESMRRWQEHERTHRAPRSASEPGSRAEDPSLLTVPLVVSGAREAVELTDDAIRALLGMPAWLNRLLDDDATGLMGRDEVTALMALVAAAAGVRETAVEVTKVSGKKFEGTERPSAPADLRDHIALIPDGDPADGRIRVSEIEATDGTRRWTVYLGGTSLDEDQPSDMLSNFRLSAGLDSGAERAARQAMEAAGIEPGDHVTFVGYSQGGLLASRLVETGDWRTDGLLTVGSPGTYVDLPDHIPHLALEHSEDIITALNGERHASGPVIFTRSALGGELGEGPLGGHHLDDYIDTAAAVDATPSGEVVEERARLIAATSGTVVSTVTFAAHRVSPPAPQPTPVRTPRPEPGPAPSPEPRPRSAAAIRP